MRPSSVLIVGGGVVGLTGALFLARHGVRCVLAERHPDLLIHPRARGLTPRTMEVYRQAGLQQAIAEAAYGGPGFAWTPVQAGTLDDEEYGTPDEPDEDDGSAASPCGFGPIDQDRLEVLLRDEARRLGAELRFSVELTSFAQDADGVTAALTDRTSGRREVFEADYMIAADGYASPVRHALGIEVDGPGQMFTTLTAIVAADLTPALRGRRATIAYLRRPRPFTILMAHDDAGARWVFGTGYDAERESLEDYTDERVVEMVRAAAGLPDVKVELLPQIPGTDLKVLGFPIGAHVARRYRAGRVFLAGDAAHVWPPTGGLGAGTGIQDAHNLAWKLAMVLDDAAGPGLLDTYETERRAVGLLTMEQALARFGTRMAPAAGDGPGLIDYAAISMGYRYPTLGDPDTAPRPPAALAGRPGTRAPHVPLPGGGSTLDLFGAGLVLLTAPEGAPAWAAAAGAQDVPIARHILDAPAARAYGLAGDGAALIRPDGFVAWRAESSGADHVAALTGALRAALAI